MSRLGFDKIIKNLPRAKAEFLKKGMVAARREFRRNFNTESNAETGQSWEFVVRGYPPSILDVEGNLRDRTLNSTIRYYTNKAVLTCDPIDKRGRGYAQYHEDGFHHLQAGWIAPRSFITQSQSLDREQEQILRDAIDKIL